MFNFDTLIRARYAETDSMGIVHHSNYPIWFEVGRTEFFKSIGFSYVKFEEAGGMLPLINLKCSFKSPAKYDDEVIIRTFISEATKTRICFGYEVLLKIDDKLLCSGETEHVFTDKTLKPINIKKIFPEYYEMYMKYAQKVG